MSIFVHCLNFKDFNNFNIILEGEIRALVKMMCMDNFDCRSMIDHWATKKKKRQEKKTNKLYRNQSNHKRCFKENFTKIDKIISPSLTLFHFLTIKSSRFYFNFSISLFVKLDLR